MAFPTSDRRSGAKYSKKIETRSIFIGIIAIIEQARDIEHCQAALVKINFRNQCCHERHQTNASSSLDLQHIWSRQVQHRPHRAALDTVGCRCGQAEEVPVIELSSVGGS